MFPAVESLAETGAEAVQRSPHIAQSNALERHPTVGRILKDSTHTATAR